MNEPVQHYSNDAQLAHQEVLLQKTYNLLAWSFLPAAVGALVSMVFNPLAMVGNYWVAVAVMFAFFYGICFAIEKNRYSQTGGVLLRVVTCGVGVFWSRLV